VNLPERIAADASRPSLEKALKGLSGSAVLLGYTLHQQSVDTSVRKSQDYRGFPDPYLGKHPDFNKARRMVTCLRMAADLCGRSRQWCGHSHLR